MTLHCRICCVVWSPPMPPIDRTSLRLACARGLYQAAYSAAGLAAATPDYRAAAVYIEAAKAVALAQLTANWSKRHAK